LYRFDVAKMVIIRNVTSCSHAFTGPNSASDGSGVVSFIQGRAGDVSPACSPLASVRDANRPVESMMFWFRLSPRLRSLAWKRTRRGIRKSARSRQWLSKLLRSLQSFARKVP
jgi:F420-0:gamma-glutamyl ligase-like protein